MKQCIWCRKNEDEAAFNRIAHTVPQSLGGRYICRNVCDECNFYFGTHQNGSPSIEAIIKETFNITRARLLNSTNDIGKNKALPRFKSTYFDVNFKTRTVNLKGSYNLNPDFQQKICRLLKRGLYKIFLEETERQKGNALNPQYDFIREFARYDKGDSPIIYFVRIHDLIATITEWVKHPEFILDEKYKMKYLVNDPSFHEFEFLGHALSVATTRDWRLYFESYIMKSLEAKIQFFKGLKFVENFNDIDLALRILNN
jgi:hypothetical protein